MKAGTEFYLVLCDSVAVGQLYLATWDGVLLLLEHMHGADLTAEVAQHLDRYVVYLATESTNMHTHGLMLALLPLTVMTVSVADCAPAETASKE